MSKPKPERSNDRDPIRDQLRAARQEKGWSQAEAARRSGIPAVVIGSWERGDRNPASIPAFRQWASLYGRTLVILEPDQRVVSTKDSDGGDEVITFHVLYGPPASDGSYAVIDCGTHAEANQIAAAIPFARVAWRTVSRGPFQIAGAP